MFYRKILLNYVSSLLIVSVTDKTRIYGFARKPVHVQDTDYMVGKNLPFSTIFGPFGGLFIASVTYIGFKRCSHIPKLSLNVVVNLHYQIIRNTHHFQ